MRNKYLQIYKSIIRKAKRENRSKRNVYYEKHHIVPDSFGGSSKSHNLVLLTAREHFVAHACLTRFTQGNHKSKMVYALHLMSTVSPVPGQNKRYVNSRLYEANKKVMSKATAERQKGKELLSLDINEIQRLLCFYTPFEVSEQLNVDKCAIIMRIRKYHLVVSFWKPEHKYSKIDTRKNKTYGMFNSMTDGAVLNFVLKMESIEHAARSLSVHPSKITYQLKKRKIFYCNSRRSIVIDAIVAASTNTARKVLAAEAGMTPDTLSLVVRRKYPKFRWPRLSKQ